MPQLGRNKALTEAFCVARLNCLADLDPARRYLGSGGISLTGELSFHGYRT